MAAGDITFHDSSSPVRREARLIDCLRRGAIDAAFHYEDESQVAAWLELHDAFSPARRDPAVAAIYPAAIRECLRAGPSPACVASLGCGSGWKDIDALRAAPGAAYAAIDASPGMVAEALSQARMALPGIASRGMVADLSDARGVADWIFQGSGAQGGPVLWLAFGIVPNLPAAELPLLLTALLRRPGDRCLLGANLIRGRDPAAEMAAILPQYDNALTRRWLALLPKKVGLPISPEGIVIRCTPAAGGEPARVDAAWTPPRRCSIDCQGERIDLAAGEELLLFFSNRFTPGQIQGLVGTAGLRVVKATLAPSGEEGVFEIGL